jgi:hypothetical protein
MALNEYVLKKWAALLFIGFFTTICYQGVSMYFGPIVGVVGMIFGIAISSFIANLMLRNPFRLMLEGKGLLVLDLTSSGIIRPFLVQMLPPFLKGMIDGKVVKDVFDRDAIYQLSPVLETKISATQDNGVLKLELNTDEFSKAKFVMNTMPCLIWNSQLKSLMTKEYLSKNEKKAFTSHTVLYLQRTLENLSDNVRDFARYVVESLNPGEKKSVPSWIWIVIMIIGFIALAYFAGPTIINFIKSMSGAVKQGASAASPTIAQSNTAAVITPR